MFTHKQQSLKIQEAKLMELKEDRDKSTIIAEGFNTFLSTTDRITRQKIGKDIKDLNNTRQPIVSN